MLVALVAFSALQRAENSSIDEFATGEMVEFDFQCSSASRKFLNLCRRREAPPGRGAFQCSSASRKFLNLPRRAPERDLRRELSVLFSEPKIPQCGRSVACPPFDINPFSALQRAENSSINAASSASVSTNALSVLFSEPKIPQL